MWKKDRKYNGKRKKDKIKTMVGTTLSTKITTITREGKQFLLNFSTSFTGTAGMLLHINGKYTMGKLN